jgi:hypothetical protein
MGNAAIVGGVLLAPVTGGASLLVTGVGVVDKMTERHHHHSSPVIVAKVEENVIVSTYNSTSTVGNPCTNGAHNLNPPVELLGYSISSESQVRVSIQASCCKSCGHWYDVNNTEVIIQ